MKGNPIPCFETSTETNYNISQLKHEACRLLLKKRVDTKLKSYNKADEAAKRIKVFYPESWTEEQINERQKAFDVPETVDFEVDEENIRIEAEKLQAKPRCNSMLIQTL